ncbi:hypothetical protein D4739_10600 [Nocardioides cavernaquae]|uniref:Peptidoglycan recognition protein family domain-containing protein n=2 Tax=Nocardioides cavernaquae TaxID=2321396 RepID=A0A3A5HF65_9ACTN|nr:hypothetical protein D4739_10600 [Nocardioides cavernaquae]
MRHNKARFVTICQQVLVVGAALAVLGPAADVISLDVVTRPEAAVGTYSDVPAGTATPSPAPVAPAAPTRVEKAPVDPTVTEVPVKPVEAASPQAAASDADVPRGGQVRVSAPEAVAGYGAVGVTWEAGAAPVEEDQITVQARTQQGGTWSDWSDVKYHAEEGPDARSAEGRNARPGTDPLIVGDVDQVQTRVITSAGVNADDLQMAVVDPGRSKATGEETPAIDGPATPSESDATTLETNQGDIALQAGTVARPTIYSRAQWGADESLRRAAPSYGTITAGFVHHTVNANNYTAEQVPGIIRSIYAYHVKTRGWNDIGYNFLLDRFGRVWEGRYGGVDRPVVGAHTEGYNSYAFAGSAIGNFEEVQPTTALLDAYGKLFAWKLSLHGVNAQSTTQKVGSRTLPAINGHRDVGSTACPGRYLYAQIPTIRTKAAQAQAGGTPTMTPRAGNPRVPNLAGDAYPDLVVRRASDGAAMVVPTGGLLSFGAQKTLSTGWSRYDVHQVVPDMNGDGRADMFVRVASTGTAGIRPGNGAGAFGRALKATTSFIGYDLITPVGRFDGNRTTDMVARQKSTGNLVLFRGDGTGAFSRVKMATGFAKYDRLVATGDLTGDGKVDLLARAAGSLDRFAGNGVSGVGAPVRLPGTWGTSVLAGFGDLTGDGRGDLLLRNNAGNTYVAPGTGKGGFSATLGPLTGSLAGLSSVATANITGTADNDAVGFVGDSLVVVPHTGRQNLRPAIAAGVSFANANLVLNVGDWDGDGLGDAITRVASSGDLFLYRGLGAGRLAAGTLVDTRNFNGVTELAPAGDVNGDGRPDLIARKAGSVVLFPGAGLAALGTSVTLREAVTGDGLLSLGRWNADSTLDLAVRNSAPLTWLPNSTDAPRALAGDLSGLGTAISAGDVTGDGRVDLLGVEGSRTWLLAGTTTGFAARRYLGVELAAYDLIG